MRVVTAKGIFDKIAPDSEANFEESIKSNLIHIFGDNRYYIDCKRRIGRGNKFSIPDAYLLDLKRNDPRLFVIENELSTHDLFKHVGIQLLEFSHNYCQAGRQVKTVLHEEISKNPEIMQACEKYANERGYRNLDYLLEYIVFETPFQAIVIIDEETDELNSVIKQFRFPVEVIEFTTFKDQNGSKAYVFNPFLQDINIPIVKLDKETPDIGELDTIVVPAREDGFIETFLGENRWYAIRIHSSMIPQIKYIAAYRVAPISAITHIAPINNIVRWKDTNKYCLEFAEPAHEINPIKLDKAIKGLAPQAPRYTTIIKINEAKVLSDIF
jgi:hypothetical protein